MRCQPRLFELVRKLQPADGVFSSLSGTQTFGATETGWSNSPFSKTFTAKLNATAPNSCTAVASLNATSGTSFTVTPLNYGLCYLTLTDFTGGQTQTVWIAVTGSTFTTQ